MNGATTPTVTCISPGKVWLDTAGNRIHAHGGSILEVDGVFYWYGENKERSTRVAVSGTGESVAIRPPICTTGPTSG